MSFTVSVEYALPTPFAICQKVLKRNVCGKRGGRGQEVTAVS